MEAPDLETIAAELDRLEGSTPAQRQLLFKLGRSRTWQKKWARTKKDAALAIELALDERKALEQARIAPGTIRIPAADPKPYPPDLTRLDSIRK
jgi:hypothetical protein